MNRRSLQRIYQQHIQDDTLSHSQLHRQVSLLERLHDAGLLLAPGEERAVRTRAEVKALPMSAILDYARGLNTFWWNTLPDTFDEGPAREKWIAVHDEMERLGWPSWPDEWSRFGVGVVAGFPA